nr:hypothetical protein [Tanacetum cinerariifolium]
RDALHLDDTEGDLSTHSTKYISPALTQKVFANMRRVGKGCSGVETPLFEGMLAAREPENQGNAEAEGDEEEQGTAAEEPVTAAVDDDHSIPSPTSLTTPPQQPQYIPSTSHVRDNAADAQVEGRQADIYHIDMDHAAKVLSIETVSAAAVVQADIPTAL